MKVSSLLLGGLMFAALAGGAAGISSVATVWPIPVWEILAVHTRPAHDGVDILAKAGTPVIAPEALRIVRVQDGSGGSTDAQRRAGQWVDARNESGRILRFLHLRPGAVRVRPGQRLAPGAAIGEIAEVGTSGVMSSAPHLHFEIRASDWSQDQYGAVLNPLDYLPPTGRPVLDRQLAALRSRGLDGLA